VTAADLTEMVAGVALLGALALSRELDDDWIERHATLILKGIGT
jgi:hypothetical protein